MSSGTVIVGAGQAGAQVATSLRASGYTDSVTLIGDEPHLPYNRPPLSKDFMANGLRPGELTIRPADYYQQRDIGLVTGTSVVSIDRFEKSVETSSSMSVPYDHLVLATGARNRRLPSLDESATNVHYLRTVDDAQLLRNVLDHPGTVLVIGAGFIGMEFAAAAGQRGARALVVESAPRPLGRAVSGITSDYFVRRQVARGVQLLCHTSVGDFRTDDAGRVTSAHVAGQWEDVDAVLVGIGVLPNTDVAEAAGLEVDDGIIVDQRLVTSDPCISAIGDCARFPQPDGPIRLESVQNAADQARYVAGRICGVTDDSACYAELPWFWSHQAEDKLQIAGLSKADDESVILGDPESGRFSVCRIRHGRLVAVESVNSAGDHLASRRLLNAHHSITAEELRAPAFSLRSAAKSAGGRRGPSETRERTSA